MNGQPFLLPAFAAGACFVGLGIHAGPLATDEAEFRARAEQLGTEEVSSPSVNGVAMAAAVSDEVLFEGAWGFVDEEDEEPISASSAFPAGALAPHFLATAALRLADRGDLDLRRELTGIFPELAGGDDAPSAVAGVSLGHLLSQTSGIPSARVLNLPDGVEHDPAPLFASLREQGLEFNAGECLDFSTTNVLLLGLAVERAAKMPVEQVLAREVFGPAGMEDTGYDENGPSEPSEEAAHEVAGDLVRVGGGATWFSAERLHTTVRDLLRFQRALVDGKLVNPDTYARMCAPTMLAGGHSVAYGLGMSSSSLADHDCVTFGGGLGESLAHVAYYPELDFSIALLASGDGADLVHFERSAARAFMGVAEHEVHDLPLPEDAGALYSGAFYIGCTRYVVRVEGDHLVLLPPEQPAHELLYQGAHVFVSERDPSVRVRFGIQGERAETFVLEERGAQSVARRMD